MNIYGWAGLLATVVASFAAGQGASAEPVSFVVLGDAPYRAEQRPEFRRLIERINESRPAFSIHVGDAKSGGEPCTDAVFDRIAADLAGFDGPLVFTPGDNDWTDCHRAGDPGAAAPALEQLRGRFFPAMASLGRAPMPLLRQSAELPAFAEFVENARWSRGGISFAVLHIVGSNDNFDCAAEEHGRRLAANGVWLDHVLGRAREEGAAAAVIAFQANVFKPIAEKCRRESPRASGGAGLRQARQMLERGIAAFDRPVLVVHGDDHVYCSDRPAGAPDNLVRLMTYGEADINAVRVTVDAARPEPFAFASVLGGRAPGPCPE
jgi:hypothetical protein